ncbi:NUDIX hydrolase [Terrisporobacter petrolearius]|uniref:NUDIX hydrolase n=1 Tax=Terrisporobacter petrolearius TaxID=1460447 RepID=UPI001D15F828|nr:NUDIX hydrolase [Terrisporobacter petrolearius]MCC3863020.1 NUDIX hydrolase [Terrisporobacter petrolearius]
MSRIKNITSLVETKFISLYNVKYLNKNNKEKNWTVASRKKKEVLEGIYLKNEKDKVDAVIICAYHKESEKLVLIKEFRVPINKYIYELPAGLVDSDDENFESAVIRELKEETGLDVTEIKKDLSCNQVYLSPGMTDESAAFVYCICEGEISSEYLEDDEDIEAVLVSKEEAKEIIKNNQTSLDIRAYLALQSFSILGEKMFL